MIDVLILFFFFFFKYSVVNYIFECYRKLICRRETKFNRVFFLRFAQTTIHGFEKTPFYFMLSGRISINIGENIFRSYTGITSENTEFHVLVA